MPKTRKGRKADADAPKPDKPRRGALLSGLPRWVQDHARKARDSAKTPSEVVQRWGGVLDGILGAYMESVEDDRKLEGGVNWEGLTRVVGPLAEARRKMAATEAELQPRSYDRVEVVVVGGLPDETIWTTEHVNADGSAVVRVSKTDSEDG